MERCRLPPELRHPGPYPSRPEGLHHPLRDLVYRLRDESHETKLQALPPGSFYVEPAGAPHFIATKDEPVVLQLSGMGPTATKLLDQAKAHK